MKLRKKIILVSIIFLLIGISIFSVNFFMKDEEILLSYEEKMAEFINIDEYTDEQMNTYLEEVTEITSSDNKENMLIVTSKEKIIDENAVNIVAAPNNQYFIEYKDTASKDKAFENFSSNEDIYAVSENEYLELTEFDSQLNNTYNSWGIEATGLDVASNIANTKNLPEVVVSIIDSGLDVDLFNQNYSNKIFDTYNVLDGSSNVDDNNGHGTHIAGTIAEGTPDNVKIFPVVVAENMKSIYTVDVIATINYLVQEGNTDVINMSLGWADFNLNFELTIQSAIAMNIVVVTSAGNDTSSKAHYPSDYNNVISVSATNSLDELADFSNYGLGIDFAAPGDEILSINGFKSGTSMAAPHVASAAAILKSYNVDYDSDNVLDILKYYATDLGEAGKDINYGHGLINLKNIIYCEDVSCTDPIEYMNSSAENVVKIEIKEGNNIPEPLYDFRSITNFKDVEVNVYYEDDKYYTKKLFELEGVTITGYDPDVTETQNIVINYKEESATFSINWTGLSESAYTYEVLEDNTIAITDIKLKSEIIDNLVIPSSIDGYVVSSFKDTGTKVVKVTFPETVTFIGDKAFEYNVNLTEINILAPYVDLGYSTFFGAHRLKQINGSIRDFQSSAFSDTYSLKTINLADTANSIPSSSFNGSGITSLVLPESLGSIEESAFVGAEHLSSITSLGTSCVFVGSAAFQDLTELKTVGFDVVLTDNFAFSGSGVEEISLCSFFQTSIPYGSFSNSNIKNITIPSRISIIESYAFSNTKNLDSVEILSKDSIKVEDKAFFDSSISSFNGKINYLGEGAFSKASNIDNIVLDESIENIGVSAFNEAISLQTINFPKSLTYIGGYAFNGATSLQSVSLSEGLTSIGEYAFNGATSLQSVSLPNSLYRIGTGAFHYTNLESLHISDQLDSISGVLGQETFSFQAFYNINNLKNITVSEDNVTYNDGNGSNVLIDPVTNTLLLGSSNSVIPATVKNIASYAFYGNKHLTNINIPSSVTNIEAYAFGGNLNLSEIVLPKTLENISPLFLTGDDNSNEPDTDALLRVYLNSYAHNFVKSNSNLKYMSIEPINTTFNLVSNEFEAFDKITAADFTSIEYEYETNDNTLEAVEDVTSSVSAIYGTGNDSLRVGDTQVGVVVQNKYGIEETKYVNITVNKATPSYTVPTGLTAYREMTLDDIALPEGFEWEVPGTVLNNLGINEYTVKFVPDDTVNYETITNINVSVNVLYAPSDTDFENLTQNKYVIYNGSHHNLDINIDRPDYVVKYKDENGSYTLNNAPGFKSVGIHLVEYTISVAGSVEQKFYNTVNIYGIKEFNTGITEKGASLVVSGFDNGFDSIENKIDIFSTAYNITYYDKADNVINTSEAATGNKIKININGQKDFMYDLVVLGDVYADSRISALDYISIKNHIMKTNEISDPIIKEAADVNSDSKISALDYITIKNHIMSGGN